jgi:hypothetical protein
VLELAAKDAERAIEAWQLRFDANLIDYGPLIEYTPMKLAFPTAFPRFPYVIPSIIPQVSLTTKAYFELNFKFWTDF